MLKKLVPKRFGERSAHRNLRKLHDVDLHEGDILIAKVWGNDAWDAAFVRAAQATFSHVRGGSSQSEHVLLNCRDGGTYTVETLSRGTYISYQVERRDHVVYRCRDVELAREASRVGQLLAGVSKIAVGSQAGDGAEIIEARQGMAYAQHYNNKQAEIKYRNPVGIASTVFRTKSRGRNGNARIAHLSDLAYGGKSAAGVSMICSEFIAACYEIASDKLGTPPPFGAGVNPGAMTAKALEAVLNRNGSLFKLKGRYAGTKETPQSDREAAGRLMMAFRMICKEMGESVSVTDAYVQIQGDPALWDSYKDDAPDMNTWQKRIAQAVKLGI